MEIKLFRPLDPDKTSEIIPIRIKQLSEKGEGVAVIATLNVIDKDRDVTLPGAFSEQSAGLVPAHNWHEPTMGKARIVEDNNQALAEFKMNLDMSLGREWYSSIKFDLDHPPVKQEYSYGYDVLESSEGQFEDQPVRFLKSLKVHEVSPVLLGAGIATRTLALKGGGIQYDGHGSTFADDLQNTISQVEAVILRAKEIKALRQKGGKDLSGDRTAQIDKLYNLVAEFEKLFEKEVREGAVSLGKFKELEATFRSLRQRGMEA